APFDMPWMLSARRFGGVLSCIVCATARVAAQTPIVHVGLDEAIALAIARNPDAKLAQAAVDSAVGEKRIAKSLPSVSLASIPNTPFQYGATVPVDVTPARFYRSRVGALGVSAAEADRSDTRRVLAANVAHAFYDVLLADDKRAIAEQRRDAVSRVLVSDS